MTKQMAKQTVDHGLYNQHRGTEVDSSWGGGGLD